MPKQLQVLLIVFAIFISLFIIIRHLLIPDSFGEYGHYRGDALEEIASQELKFAGKEACIDCHSDIYEMLLSDMHANLDCEICHGPGQKHADSMEASDILKKTGREFCGLCHAINPARPNDVISQINLNEHNIEIENCTDCHNPHQVWEINE